MLSSPRADTPIRADSAIAAPYLTELRDGQRVALSSQGRRLTLVGPNAAALTNGGVGLDSTFIVRHRGQSKLSLKSAEFDGYLMGSDWQNGRLRAGDPTGGSTRSDFWLEEAGNSKVALRLVYNDKYVVEGADGRLYARGAQVNAAMTFEVESITNAGPVRVVREGSERERELRYFAIPAP